MRRAVSFALLAALAAACGPTLTARSSPPPGRIASFAANEGHYDLELSQGVAIVIGCEHGGPCKNVRVSSTDATIVDVRGATFGALEQAPLGYVPATTPAGVVLVGKAPGHAKVKVKTSDGSKTIHVTVVEPPVLGSPASAVARP